MFAFGIWDDRKKVLFLARDRIGIKPLYYYKGEDKFIFASELKAIVEDKTIPRKINPTALMYFLMNTYIPSPYSIWENIYKLPPGHYLIFNKNHFKIRKYWNLKLMDKKVDERIYINKIRDLLKKSIEYRFISDVPVGILLSGGLDSSTITAIGSKIKKELSTFSIGFEPEEYSELKYARIVAEKFKTRSIEKVLNLQRMKGLMDKVLYHYDEPLGVSSIFPTLLLMETASKNVKVSISGDGGDEVFAGYIYYSEFLNYNRFNFLYGVSKLIFSILSKIFKSPENRFLKIFMRKLKHLSFNEFDRYRSLITPRFERSELKSLFCKDFLEKCKEEDLFKNYAKNGLKNIKDLQYFDIKTFLVDSILVKVDRASMAYSLEVRVPLLDHILLEYVFSLNKRIIFKNHEKKYILKKISKNILPYEIIHRKKKGFSAPLVDLGFFDEYLYVLKDPFMVRDNILNKKYIDKLIHSKYIDYAKLWLLILFELWYRKWKLS